MEKVELDMDSSSLPKEKLLENTFLVKLGDFWWYPNLVEQTKGVINHFNPLPTDVILATFPKTGTTWLKSLVYSILNRSSMHKLTTQNPHELVPFLTDLVFRTPGNITAASTSSSDDRRLFATHIPYQLLSKNLDSCQCKVVYLTRNPKDTLVSTWHFFNRMKKENQQPWAIDDATDSFCRGVIPGGPFYDHVIGYWELSLKRPDHAMFVTYEGMKEDPHGHVKKLGEFLGCPFKEDEDDVVDEIVKKCSFEALSRHEVNKSKESLVMSRFPSNSFFREGISGDHENYLSDEASRRIDALTIEKFHSLGFVYGI